MAIQFNALPVTPLRITSPFGPRNTGINGATTYHQGIDLGRNWNLSETPVCSVASGTVSSSYWNEVRGWVLIVNHGKFQTLYQHLKNQGTSKGTAVTAGQRIGTMGHSSATLQIAEHLHLELIVSGQRIDPEPYLKNIVPVSASGNEEGEEEMKKFETLQEVPVWAKPAIETGVKNGWIAADSTGKFFVWESNLQTAVWFYAAGIWNAQAPART